MKCDELKPLVFSLNDLAYVDERAVENNFENPHDHAVYKTTEVDAAIEELKQKLMPCLNGDCILTCEVVEKYGKENAELKAELDGKRHSDYKRCLAMAKWCEACSFAWSFIPEDDEVHKSDFYGKWKLRWMKLAEKFKEE